MKEPPRLDRNRLAAFAFAGADVLVEVDSEGSVTFCTGTTRALLQREPESLLGRPFEAFAATDDRFLARELLKRTTDSGRVASLVLRMQNQAGMAVPFTVSGIALPEFFGRLHLSCCKPRGMMARATAAPPVVGPEAFSVHLAQAAESGEASGEPYEVVLLEIALERFRETASPEDYVNFVGRLEAKLRASASAGTPLGRLDTGKYGVIRDAGCDPRETLMQEVGELSRGSAEGLEPFAATVQLAGGPKKAEDRASAVRTTLGRFLRMGGRSFGVASLGDGLRLAKEPVRRQQADAVVIHRPEQHDTGKQFVRQEQRRAS